MTGCVCGYIFTSNYVQNGVNLYNQITKQYDASINTTYCTVSSNCFTFNGGSSTQGVKSIRNFYLINSTGYLEFSVSAWFMMTSGSVNNVPFAIMNTQISTTNIGQTDCYSPSTNGGVCNLYGCVQTIGKDLSGNATGSGAFNNVCFFNTSSTNACPPNVLHHIVITRDKNASVKAYLDGVLQPGSYTNTNIKLYRLDSLWIGMGLYGNGSGASFTGNIYAIKVYNYILPLSTIKYIYNTGKSANGMNV